MAFQETQLQSIVPDNLYPLPVLMRHCGFSRKSWDAARRSGLVSHRAGKRVFVLGSDFIYWVINRSEPVVEGETTEPKPPPTTVMPKTLLTRSEAAEFLSLKPNTLAIWAITGKGPRLVKIGRAVRYRVDDLESFLHSATR